MKEKFDSIRKRLTEMQASAHSLVSDIDLLLGEMDSKKAEVVDLDKKEARLHETEQKISEATKELVDIQNKHVSVTQRLQEMKESIKV